MSGSPEPSEEVETLADLIERLGHYLPAQGPISVFIHHNTLHAFEHLPFEQAVVEAGLLFGCEPFRTEAAFQAELTRGRVTRSDLEWALRRELGDGADLELVAGAGSRLALRLAMLRSSIVEPTGSALDWILAESNVIARKSDQELWGACRGAIDRIEPEPDQHWQPERHRDAMLTFGADDSDLWVHPLLTRLCAAFLDQGVAAWPLRGREGGFYVAVRTLLGRGLGLPDAWARGMRASLRDEETRGFDALHSIEASLAALGVGASDRESFLRATFLALRGWPGMMRQFELRPDRAPVHALPATLVDFVAVRLVLDRYAVAYVARAAGLPLKLDALRASLEGQFTRKVDRRSRAFLLLQGARAMLWTPEFLAGLTPEQIQCLVNEMVGFGDVARRTVYHHAYERHHREGTLDALATQWHDPAPTPREPSYQVMCCIDERQESLRRHIEEVDPNCETIGTAGFFGVAMYYRGIAAAVAVPLCPPVIQATHLVEEIPVERVAGSHRRSARLRRWLGNTSYGTVMGSRTLGRGALLSAGLGAFAALPLVARVLFPRLTAWLRSKVESVVAAPRATRLTLEADGPLEEGKLIQRGFEVEQMADIVEGQLRMTGLLRPAPLIFVLGHGSNSLNNPHESAHDCGACGGGRGGPNARAFAQIANDSRVRESLARRGLTIPTTTWFVGGLHDTCDDDVRWFDLEAVPSVHALALKSGRRAIDAARVRDAHERSRRFVHAPRRWTPARALGHVQERAADLAQVRPEYGHATNAVCVVGRRSRTRGLFMDRRAFLISYDALTDDDDAALLGRILGAVVPVVAGISLEYYFSFVDPQGYGCGTKLPHNITALLGVIDGHQSDLRTGLPWQMVEIHEPVRLLMVVETTPERMMRVMERLPSVGQIIRNAWIQLTIVDPATGGVQIFDRGEFSPYYASETPPPTRSCSSDWYSGHIDHLGYARIDPGAREVGRV